MSQPNPQSELAEAIEEGVQKQFGEVIKVTETELKTNRELIDEMKKNLVEAKKIMKQANSLLSYIKIEHEDVLGEAVEWYNEQHPEDQISS